MTTFDSIITLQDLLPRPKSLDSIMQAVSVVTALPINQITSQARHVAIVRARKMYFGIARNMTERSSTVIGRHCGKREHSTVLHGVAEFSKMVATDERFLADVKAVEKLVELGR